MVGAIIGKEGKKIKDLTDKTGTEYVNLLHFRSQIIFTVMVLMSDFVYLYFSASLYIKKMRKDILKRFVL